MKIPIIMPTYNRPQYLVQVLEGLSKCESLDKFYIITSEEPGQPLVSKLFNKVNFIEIRRYVNKAKLGCNANISSAITRELKNNERVVVLEDDIIPGRDFLNYFLWGFENLNPKEMAVIAAYNSGREDSPIEQLSIVHKYKWFHPWGWGTWKKTWDDFYKLNKENLNRTESWDSQFQKYLLSHDSYYELQPEISRSQNIGEIGTYVPSPEWQRENQRCLFWIETKNLEPVKIFKLKEMEHYYQKLNGWFDFEDIYKEMVELSEDKARFVEIGSFMGKSAAFLGVEILNSKKQIKLDCVDTFAEDLTILNLIGIEDWELDMSRKMLDIFKENTLPIKKIINNIYQGYSVVAASLYESESLDFVFIDAGHTYEEVKEDIEAWFPKVKKGGYIGGHDYCTFWGGVIQAVSEKFKEEELRISKNSWIIKK